MQHFIDVFVFNMALLRIISRAMIFIRRLRFPPGRSIVENLRLVKEDSSMLLRSINSVPDPKQYLFMILRISLTLILTLTLTLIGHIR